MTKRFLVAFCAVICLRVQQSAGFTLQQQHQQQRQQHRPLEQQWQKQQPFLAVRATTTSAVPTTTSRLFSSTQERVRTPKTKKSDDARGAALLMEHVSVQLGDSLILQDINWRVEPRTKWALVGVNGAGKSTLIKAIVGDVDYFDGKISVGAASAAVDGGMAYLQQTAVAGSTRTVFEEAASGMTLIEKARLEMERAADEEDLDALNEAIVLFEAAGGYQQEQTVSSVLKGLGFTEADLQKSCKALSGGWQMRVALARTLLSEAATVILDEPSNHLDAAAKKWLANYLRTYGGDNKGKAGGGGGGSMILVTHDVELLDSMDNIAELVPGNIVIGTGSSLHIFKSCTHEEYLDLKQLRAEAAQKEFEKNTEKAAKLQAFVDRFGASAARASAAQSKLKQLQKMQKAGLLAAPATTLVTPKGNVAQNGERTTTIKGFKPSVKLPEPPRTVGEILLSLKDNAQVGYEEGKTLVTIKNAFDITRGMKLLIRGPNGAGKSTVLHSLRGTLPLIAGSRVENPLLRLGMFTQDLAQELDVTARAVDLVTAYAREGDDGNIFTSDQDARNAMGRLGLQGDKALRKVGDLSGGEKARVALAMFSLKPSNLYLLDEASNHLDVECVEALSDALSQWGGDQGAIVVVSHDRNFCQKIEFTHVATVADGKLVLEQRRAVPSDFEILGLSLAATATEATETTPPETNTSTSTASAAKKSVAAKGSTNKKSEVAASAPAPQEMDPALRKKAFNAPKRIPKLEAMVEKLEQQIAEIDEEMLKLFYDVDKLVELNKQKEKLQEEVAGHMEEWEELEELLRSVN